AAALRMAIDAYFALPMHRQEVEPMPKRRKRGARDDGCRRMVKSRCQRDYRRGIDRVFDSLAAPDPRLKLILLFVHVVSFIDCTKWLQLWEASVRRRTARGNCNVWCY